MTPGVCELCGEPAYARCRLCGRLVCKKHYDPQQGVCTACLESLCSICNRRLSVTTCSLCGRLICRECSVEVEPGIRICIACYNRLQRPPKTTLADLLRKPHSMESAARLALSVLPLPRPPTRY